MEWLIIVISISTLASTLPVEKETKSFSLFSLVSFPNEECATTMTTLTTGAPVSGLCLTTEECTASGGKPEGNCASGFGVCCFISVEESGAILTKNITYIQNSGYPSLIGDVVANPITTTILTFTLEGSSDICQTRWDFEDVVLQQPTAAQIVTGGAGVNGQCGGIDGDSIVIASPSTDIVGFESLCGTLTGHHIYIPNSGINDAATITITIGQGVFGRQWRIKTTRIECTNPSRAPEGCLQFFTGVGGQFTSFNFLDGVNPILIRNLLYSVCIRAEKGFCGLNVAETRTATLPDSFNLQTATVVVAPAVVPAGVGMAACAAAAPDEFVGIGGNIFCGALLAATDSDATAGVITLNSLPFRITVAADEGVRLVGTGFDLTYRQVPC